MSVVILIAAVIMTVVVVFQFVCRLGVFGQGMAGLAARHPDIRNGNVALAVVLWALWLYLRP
jgi:hypothetical protein